MQPRQPGKPSLLASLNDRIVVDLLLEHGSLTRAGIAELSGLSKVSASQIIPISPTWWVSTSTPTA
jgi:hypothetical protein